jgi:hypothetical protein
MPIFFMDHSPGAAAFLLPRCTPTVYGRGSIRPVNKRSAASLHPQFAASAQWWRNAVLFRAVLVSPDPAAGTGLTDALPNVLDDAAKLPQQGLPTNLATVHCFPFICACANITIQE